MCHIFVQLHTYLCVSALTFLFLSLCVVKFASCRCFCTLVLFSCVFFSFCFFFFFSALFYSFSTVSRCLSFGCVSSDVLWVCALPHFDQHACGCVLFHIARVRQCMFQCKQLRFFFFCVLLLFEQRDPQYTLYEKASPLTTSIQWSRSLSFIHHSMCQTTM